MGTHPIFESDFDCLTERGLTIEMLSRVSRPIAQKLIQKRFGGTFAYFVQKTGNRVWENEHNNFQLRYIVRGVLLGFGLGLGVQIIFGVPEGPYYYDPEQYTPEEYELVQTALGRFLYKYWFTSLRVGHWNTCAGLRFGDENQCRDRLVQDVRRIATQIGSVGLNTGQYYHGVSAGGISDRHAGLHSTSPQVLNEMIQYADEHEIMRTRDAIVNKVFMDKGEGAWRHGITVEFGEIGQTLRLPAVGVAPSPHEKPKYYDIDAPTRDQKD